MNLVEAVQSSYSLVETVLPSINGLSPTNLLISAGSLTALWLIGRASSAIVGEYGKRFWFRYIHRDVLRKRKDALVQMTAELNLARQEQARLEKLIKRLKDTSQIDPYVREASEMLSASAKHFRLAGMEDKALYYEKMAWRLCHLPVNDVGADERKSA